MAQVPRCEAGCGRRALTWWSQCDTDEDGTDWFLCGVHSDRSADTLVASGYMQVADERDAPVVVAG